MNDNNSPHAQKMGAYKRRETCRLCDSKNMTTFLDLGNVPLAGGFLSKEGIDAEEFYPLDVSFCNDCYLAEVLNIPSADKVFRRYFYFTSAIQTMRDHFAQYAQELAGSFLPPGKSFAVEIGSNDGVFLKPLQDLGIKCIGVDPATNVVEKARERGLNVINDYFTEAVATKIKNEYGAANAILTSNSFAHIDDMQEVMRGVKALLDDKGVLLVEVHYLGALIKEVQYDVIYHEHLDYYSALALSKFFKRYGMEIFDIKRTNIQGGSIRYYVRNIGKRDEPISNAVVEIIESEKAAGLDRVDTFLNFGKRVRGTKDSLMSLLEQLKSEKKRVVGYGASGRATTIMNYCGLDSKYLEYVIDDAPAKQGYYTPGTHLLIKAWDEADKPDYLLNFAWNFTNEVKERRKGYLLGGGKLIAPLPEVVVISQP
jgi:methylation protein EvaC